MSEFRISFIANGLYLKPIIECNTIAQVLFQFNYVERWGKSDVVKKYISEDSENVINFFDSIKKLSNAHFQSKKFKELWDRYNMTDICDYCVNFNKEGQCDLLYE